MLCFGEEVNVTCGWWVEYISSLSPPPPQPPCSTAVLSAAGFLEHFSKLESTTQFNVLVSVTIYMQKRQCVYAQNP